MTAANTLRETLASRQLVVAVAVGWIVFVCAAALPNAGLLDEEQVGDTPTYERYGSAMLEGEIPYRDFFVEYPPGALPVFAAPAAGSDAGYATRFKLLMLAFGLAVILLVALTLAASGASAAATTGATALVGIVPAALGPVVLVNYDLWPTLFVVAAVAALVFARGATAGALLGAGFAAKVFPVVLLPIAFLHLRAAVGPQAARRCVIGFAAAAALLIVPFALLAPGAIRHDLSIALRRGLQIESLGSSILLAAHRLGLYEPTVNSDLNSQNLGGDLPRLLASFGTVAALAAVVAVVLLHRSRAGGTRALLLACAAAITFSVAFAKVLSPQFLVWIVPLVALTGSLRAYALVLAALMLTQAWFPTRYGDLVALGEVSWLVLVRNLVLVALAVVLARSLARLRAGP